MYPWECIVGGNNNITIAKAPANKLRRKNSSLFAIVGLTVSVRQNIAIYEYQVFISDY